MKQILYLMVAANLVALFFFFYNAYFYGISPDPITTYRNSHLTFTAKFDDPDLAFKILSNLTLHRGRDSPSNRKRSYFGMIGDYEHCDKHLSLFVKNPTFIFQEINFISNYGKNMLARQVAKQVGNDLHPQVGYHMSKKKKQNPAYVIPANLNLIWTNGPIGDQLTLEQQYGCLTQAYNHIESAGGLSMKSSMAKRVVEYAEKYKTRPQCFSYDKFFPKTWILNNQEQCEDFFNNHFQGPEYEKLKAERKIVFISKDGASHQAKGVNVVDEKYEKVLRSLYGNGTRCGKNTETKIVQNYIYNPLLLNGHKFDFRIYLVVGSTNPTMVFYHDGFLRVSLHPYNVSSSDKSVLLTNTALSKKTFDIAKKEGTYQGLNETELRNFQMWNFDRLQNYLLEKNKIKDTKWLDEYLRPEFKKAMVHLTKMTKQFYTKKSQTFELFGCDFMLDDNLNVWFIECNSGPVLSGSSDEKLKFITKMLKDLYEIEFGFLKSRSKRIIVFINEVIKNKQYSVSPSGDVVLGEEQKKIFKQITQNHLEPEFAPSFHNGFHKIYDESLPDAEKTFGLIPVECL